MDKEIYYIIGISIICLPFVLYFVYQVLVWIGDVCARRKQRALAVEESKRKVIEQYRDKYLDALEKYASNEKMEKIDKEAFQHYIDAIKELCELPEKKNGDA